VEANGLGRVDMIMRPALDAGKHGAIDVLLKRGLANNDGAAGAAQGLVRGGGDDVEEGHGILQRLARDEPGDMGDVGEGDRPHLVGNAFESFPVDVARIGRKTGDDHAGPFPFGDVAKEGPVEGHCGIQQLVVD